MTHVLNFFRLIYYYYRHISFFCLPFPIFILSSFLPSLHPSSTPQLHLFFSSLSLHGAPHPSVQTLRCIHIQIHWMFYPTKKKERRRELKSHVNTATKRVYVAPLKKKKNSHKTVYMLLWKNLLLSSPKRKKDGTKKMCLWSRMDL